MEQATPLLKYTEDSVRLNHGLKQAKNACLGPFFIILKKTRMYTIRQKQEITDRLKDESKFSKDLQLFQKKFPRSPMNRELARVNDVNRGALCGRMIYALLDVTTEEEIERNRNSENQPTEKAENETVTGSAGAAADDTGKQPKKQPEKQPQKQPQKTPAESKKKDGKKRSSRK